ncbi:MAG: dihydrofolate reductase family protein [Deltaproteobacteria bacterium]|nr:dihydrofolate reductase family protein [Deltaproteobacteria bacterium]
MIRARSHLYIAASLDGFIADSQGSVSWLDPFNSQEYGYAAYLASMPVMVLGRRTYDQARGFVADPYPGKRVVVLTHRPLEPDSQGTDEVYSGPLHPLPEQLGREGVSVYGLVGGGDVIQQFLQADLLDVLELFVIPVLLGSGVSLFPTPFPAKTAQLRDTTHYPNGVVRLLYAFSPPANP